MAPPEVSPPASDDHRVVKLNVGGRLFHTTASALRSDGPDSLLAALSRRHADGDEQPIFIDRDPDIFSVLLSLLRSGRLPSSATRRFSTQDLADESLYYGVESALRSALAPPPLLGFDASLSSVLRPAADPIATAISAGPADGSLWVAHGGQISSYDWSLTLSSTVRTHLDRITSLRRACADNVSVLGSLDSPGLHFYDVSAGRHLASLHWSDPSDPRVFKARVTALAAEPDTARPIFAAAECPHRENCILSVDRTTLKIASEIGRQRGSSSKVAAATKLVDVTGLGLVFASAVSSGAFGYSGYMKLWDPRTGEGVWEVSEPGAGQSSDRFGDSFSGADVDSEEMKIYKVCWKSGDVAVADMRKLGGSDPWVYLEDLTGAVAGNGKDAGVHCYKRQVFVSKENGVEVWTRAAEQAAEEKRAYRRNWVDSKEAAKKGWVTMMEGGGDRLFLYREGVEGVEVWESSASSGAISLL